MTKTELIQFVKEELRLSNAKARATVETILNAIADTLVKGDKVSLPEIGVFKVVERAGRAGINPQTGEKLFIPAKKAVKFKVGKLLKDRVK